MPDILGELLFIFQRFNWLSALDLFLVTLVFFGILMLLRDTQALVLMRGVLLLIVSLSLVTSLIDLPAFSWLIRTALPMLVLAIPVIFAPEIRRGLERLGRAGSAQGWLWRAPSSTEGVQRTIRAVVSACARLSARQHGALIIFQRGDSLEEYARTGVPLNAEVTAELLLQIFYPNTPLHDGAVIIADQRIVAAACVMPLSSSGILNHSPERQMGLRHRAALGTSEATDAVAVVVSEETGAISVAHGGRIIRRLDAERLENILLAFYQPVQPSRNLLDMIRAARRPAPTRPRKED
ncbi:diadenylate cyclase CdaA [uncultured Thermanaerothrix sp.]|uniref:diadenylate cyclase CdaA n=1 Tax=uncultured Thermanaerothrix sp. TaxID=1195149 RepID=UPI00261BFE9A|nr:diadenylate cyclase CdaA [uncultured Thermanaerothrix sp.]